MFGRTDPPLKQPFNCSMVELLALCVDCSLVALTTTTAYYHHNEPGQRKHQNISRKLVLGTGTAQAPPHHIHTAPTLHRLLVVFVALSMLHFPLGESITARKKVFNVS